MQYGAANLQGDFQAQGFEPPMKSVFARGPRSGNGWMTILLCLFLPWVIFTGLYASLSFQLHYEHKQICYILVVVLAVVVLFMGYFAYNILKRRAEGSQEPIWYVFLFLTSLIAWITALTCGLQNFNLNMLPFYDSSNLNVYPSVDPGHVHGQQLMDAGRIMFTPESKLDLTKAMGFRNLEMFCVAPITSGKAKLASYDFWAVGLNCCAGHAAGFHCGEYSNPKAHAGLRLMRDEQRAYFRLAVQQAEAAHNIKASHPIFLYWMQDPMAELNAYQDDGYKYFLMGVFCFFAFQFFMVVVVKIALSKLYG